MYNINIDVSYSHIEGDEADTKFRMFFLSVFKLTEFNDAIIVGELDRIFDDVYENEHVKEVFKHLKEITKQKFPIEIDDRDLMMFLFSFDTFEYTHKLLQHFYKNNKQIVDKNLFDILIKKINE